VDGLTRPVGELPPEIYWRRRLVSGAFLVLAILVLYYLVRSLFGGGDAPTTPGTTTSATPHLTTSASPGVTTTASPGATTGASASSTLDLSAIRKCAAADVTIVLTATTHDWAGTTEPSFTGAVRQSAATQCVLDTSASDAELLVTSGAVRQWSNLDCAKAPLLTAQKLLLKPGDTATLSATWPRVRSESGCPTTLKAPGPGTYRATLTVQGVTSDQAVFALTN
jgi:hypothetical protein